MVEIDQSMSSRLWCLWSMGTPHLEDTRVAEAFLHLRFSSKSALLAASKSTAPYFVAALQLIFSNALPVLFLDAC